MSMSIYIPYFYIIQHINSGRYYAGVKFAKDSNPDNLLKPGGYQTSSDIIKQIILEEGLESFLIRKIKVFETAEQALDYELRFLRKVNAAFNDSFLNRSNNSIRALNVDYEKVKQTNLERYGVEYASQSPEIQDRIKQTCLNNLGYEHNSQSPEVKEKKKQTNLDNRGVEFPMQSPEVQEKRKKICLEKYGYECSLQNEEVKEKTKQTMLEKYGVEHSLQSGEAKEKYKQTCLENHGVENPMQSPEIQERSKQTCLEKYGVAHPLQSEEIKEKKKQTNLERYGFENPNQSEEVKEKIRQARNNLMNRPIVIEIRKYKDNFKLKLECNWFTKKQEVLNTILEEIKITYGELI